MTIKKINLKNKHIIKVIFRKKGCCKGDIVLSLSITNILSESLEPVLIFRIPCFL